MGYWVTELFTQSRAAISYEVRFLSEIDAKRQLSPEPQFLDAKRQLSPEPQFLDAKRQLSPELQFLTKYELEIVIREVRNCYSGS